MKLNDKIINVLENNGFNISEIKKRDNKYYVEINQYTPEGEDWWEVIWFNGTDEGFVEAITERYNNFDVDDEAEIYIEFRGKNGVPNSIKALIEDAEWKESTLDKLVNELEKLELETL